MCKSRVRMLLASAVFVGAILVSQQASAECTVVCIPENVIDAYNAKITAVTQRVQAANASILAADKAIADAAAAKDAAETAGIKANGEKAAALIERQRQQTALSKLAEELANLRVSQVRIDGDDGRVVVHHVYRRVPVRCCEY